MCFDHYRLFYNFKVETNNRSSFTYSEISINRGATTLIIAITNHQKSYLKRIKSDFSVYAEWKESNNGKFGLLSRHVSCVKRALLPTDGFDTREKGLVSPIFNPQMISLCQLGSAYWNLFLTLCTMHSVLVFIIGGRAYLFILSKRVPVIKVTYIKFGREPRCNQFQHHSVQVAHKNTPHPPD